MSFILTAKAIKEGKVVILYDEAALSGVKKIAAKVASDIGAVFGATPAVSEWENITVGTLKKIEYPILVGTLGCGCNILTELGIADLPEISGKREVYLHKNIENLPKNSAFAKTKSAFLIAGSDKRGTVYGLFALSEMLGVSPFIDWLDIKPERKTTFTIPSAYTYMSKEPSVRFRGFFINDEWPAFGNWCNKRFGGFNAKCYEHVFELLLRLKGNYMWPAMWSAIFPNDGPELKSAELADELGVVMGMSHHEPCLRQGEEYRYLRGPGSIYGDAWNFLKNEKGITKFWEDGLKRSGKFENVITVGMRGEADTAIMGKEATLKDNIDLLRKVLKTQNRLIKKYVKPDLDEVPRMLALYKEVEPYFYGDEKTPGLQGDPELEGVTLMLCDDNYGNLRTVPTPKMRGHKGGYGMYYHFDYHGFPISYEWFNTTHLPKVWEQMTAAYDFGIRDLWIVNVGDIFSTEYPLSYFLDLAYDFDRWGTSNRNSPLEYTRLLVEKTFGKTLSSAEKKLTSDLLLGYTRITHARRTEAMNDDVYAPFAYDETEDLLFTIGRLMKKTEALYGKLKDNVAYRFYELVYLPLMANLNVQKMWLLTTQNHAYAKMGSTYALALADEIDACMEKDQALVSELHRIHGGMWYGMGLSEHIGFKNWCEEECQYPVVHTFVPGNKDRIIVSVPGTNQYTEGYFWTRRILVMPAFLDPSCSNGRLELTTACDKKLSFTVECDADYIRVTPASGSVSPFARKALSVSIDRDRLSDIEAKNRKANSAAKNGKLKKGQAESGRKIEAKIVVRFGEAFCEIRVPVNTAGSMNGEAAKLLKTTKSAAKTQKTARSAGSGKVFPWCGDSESDQMQYISIAAEHYSENTPGTKGAFEAIPDYSHGMTAMKAYPQDRVFSKKEESPVLSYEVRVPKTGKYTLRILTNPSNPYSNAGKILFGVSANGGSMKRVNMIPEGFAVGDGNDIWKKGVLDNLRTTEVDLDLKEGANTIGITAVSPNFVLLKLVLFEKNREPMDSYQGPKETYHYGRNGHEA